MIKIGRKGRNGSQPTSSGYEGPDVRVKDRPGRFFLDGKKKKNRLVCSGLSFQALWPYKGLSDSLATPFSQLTVLCPAQQVCGAQAGAELGAKVISFSQVILFSPSSLRSLRNRRRLSNHTLPHLWGWEGSYFC